MIDITCTVTGNGDLEITANPEAREWLMEQQSAERHPDQILQELLEPYWTNGRFEPFDAGAANPFVGLTSAPCIAEYLDVHDDGTREVVGRLWWFPNYMVRDPLDDLRESGRVIFTLAPE